MLAAGCGRQPEPATPHASFDNEVRNSFQLVDIETPSLGAFVRSIDATVPFRSEPSRCSDAFYQTFREEQVAQEELLLRFVTRESTTASLGAAYAQIKGKLKLGDEYLYSVAVKTTEVRRIARKDPSGTNYFELCCAVDRSNCPSSHYVSEYGKVVVEAKAYKKLGVAGQVDVVYVDGESSYSREQARDRKDELKFVRFQALTVAQDLLSSDDLTVQAPIEINIPEAPGSSADSIVVTCNRPLLKWSLSSPDGDIWLLNGQNSASTIHGRCENGGDHASYQIQFRTTPKESRPLSLSLQVSSDHWVKEPIARPIHIFLHAHRVATVAELDVQPRSVNLTEGKPTTLTFNIKPTPTSSRPVYLSPALPPDGVAVESMRKACSTTPCTLQLSVEGSVAAPRKSRLLFSISNDSMNGAVVLSPTVDVTAVPREP